MTRWQRSGSGVGIVAVAVLALSGALVVTGSESSPETVRRVLPRHHDPMKLHRQLNQTASESLNWSGFAVTGKDGSVTDVKSSWTVPAVDCTTATGTPNGYAAFWTGIDGWNSNTVEQIGTDSDCTSPDNKPKTPTYYAWFEFYPADGFYIGDPDKHFKHFEVSPGDTMSAEVSSTDGAVGGPGGRGRAAGPGKGGGLKFTITISDTTKGWTFSTSATVPGAKQSSAEWIAETPFGCATPSQYCPLPDFNVANFGKYYTSVPNTAYATIGNVTGPIGGFPQNAIQKVTMVTATGNTVMADPSNLLGDKASFSVKWYNVGP